MTDDLFQLGERIVELAARINIATYEMLTLIAEFDRREGWAEEFTSCPDWLAWRTGRMLGTARENVRVAHALEDLPLTSAEMKTGKLSYAKVRAMTRVATPKTEKTLLKYARAGSAAKPPAQGGCGGTGRRASAGGGVRWRIRDACRAVPGGGPHRDGHAGEGRGTGPLRARRGAGQRRDLTADGV